VTSTELERKVRQLDSDVHEIYSMLDKISVTQGQHSEALDGVQDSLSRVHGTQARHGNRLSEIDGHLEGIDSALTEMRATQARQGNRLDGIDGRLDGIDGRLDRMDSRFDGVDSRFDRVDSRFDRVESKLDAVLDRLGPGPAGSGQGG
jgi:archaellum component FlaC